MKKETSRYDIHCTRCGKHVDDLAPFDLEGEIKLIKRFREVELVKRNAEYDEILQKLAVGHSIINLNKTYGASKVQTALVYELYIGNLETSWECKKCIKEDGLFKRHSRCN